MCDEIHMSISLPLGEDGMIGRKCPECDGYFKLKPGTGLADINTTACPYCEYQDEPSAFHTEAQIEYAKSIAVKRIIEPALRDLQQSFKNLERSTRGSFIQLKVRFSNIQLRSNIIRSQTLKL